MAASTLLEQGPRRTVGLLEASSPAAAAASGSGTRARPATTGTVVAVALPAGTAARPDGPAPSAVLLIDQAAFGLASLAQCLLWLSQLSKAETLTQKMQPAVVMLLTLVGLVVSLRLPHLYQRNRVLLLPMLRFLVLLVPSARLIKVGSALILERQPQPGLRGLLVDLGRLSVGTRVILIGMQGVVQTLPPTAALVTQAVAAGLTFNSREYCSTELLRHPLSCQRTAWAAAALEYAALPVLGMMPIAGLVLPAPEVLNGQAPSMAVCISFVSFFHVVCDIVLPTLVSVWCWQPSPQDQETGAAPAGSSPRSRGSIQQLWRKAAASAARADLALHRALNSKLPLVLWFLLANAWIWSKSVGGLA